jgi:hypothetical protein
MFRRLTSPWRFKNGSLMRRVNNKAPLAVLLTRPRARPVLRDTFMNQSKRIHKEGSKNRGNSQTEKAPSRRGYMAGPKVENWESVPAMNKLMNSSARFELRRVCREIKGRIVPALKQPLESGLPVLESLGLIIKHHPALKGLAGAILGLVDGPRLVSNALKRIPNGADGEIQRDWVLGFLSNVVNKSEGIAAMNHVYSLAFFLKLHPAFAEAARLLLEVDEAYCQVNMFVADYLGLIADAVEMLRADFPASDTTDAVYSLSLGGGVFQRLAQYMEAL